MRVEPLDRRAQQLAAGALAAGALVDVDVVDEAARAAQVHPAHALDGGEDVAHDLARTLGDEHDALGVRELRDEEAAVTRFGMVDLDEAPRTRSVVLAHERAAITSEGGLVGRGRGPDRDHGAGRIPRFHGARWRRAACAGSECWLRATARHSGVRPAPIATVESSRC